ncbi:MarR family winged helix-turn-helix transcriptional regulator [Granulicoccus phenolivorans]|uniref:MarR family winged helix-turn-helix transcriptional regulator n=1 Tax=Granulicoccus phenolivorans TaxID=266854 RepID=UPI00042876AA|nr:MarR family transcriptional regulator [Granulicoccus phenolivorans]
MTSQTSAHPTAAVTDPPDGDADLSALANEVRLACQRIARRVRYESTDLPPHQIGVLIRLRKRPWTPGELAVEERVSAPSMTRTVNCLVEEGLVEKYDNPEDGRQRLLRLTETGRDRAERAVTERDTWMMRRLTTLSPEQRRTLHEAVAVLQEVLHQ